MTRLMAILSVVVTLAAPLHAVAQGAPPAADAPQAAASGRSAGDRNYMLSTGDVIEVTALGQSDFGTKSSISSDGSILLPYLGTVPAAGRSPGQLAEEVRVALERGGYFAQPLIRVDLLTPASRFVTVLGAVAAPGLISLDRDYRLSEIIAKAGGRTGSGADYVVLTKETGTAQRYKIADLATGGGESDPIVSAKDKVFIPAVENEVFYLTGQVKSPGAYPATQEMTIRMALARGGGVGEMGSEKKVKVVRDGKPLARVNIDETKIMPGDVVTVGARLF